MQPDENALRDASASDQRDWPYQFEFADDIELGRRQAVQVAHAVSAVHSYELALIAERGVHC